MADLIARLEAAEEGSRELSNEMLLACGWTRQKGPTGPMWRSPDRVLTHPGPDPTRSLDAALTLVPEGWKVYKIGQLASPADNRWYGELVTTLPRLAPTTTWAYSSAPAPALALCIAALKAREKANG